MTALHSMAAAAPGISDARVPCPLCGGLVHPVAGRCKHCKEDLTSFRSGRPQAAAALPALQTVFIAPVPAAVPIALPRDGSQPILPPRPTDRSIATQNPSTWRSWPMLVIALAMIAIVVAVVIMLWPGSPVDAGKRALQPPPAPERMETNPLPPTGAGNNNSDPWGGHSQIDPPPQIDQPQIDPPTPPTAPRQTPDLLPPRGGANPDFLFTALEHACKRLKSCPDADQSLVSSMCDAYTMLGQAPSPVTCDAAKHCLDAIDKLDCSQNTFGDPMSMVTTLQDCTKAATSC